MLEDEGSDDEKSFEAVTPEHIADLEEEKGTTQVPSEKHRRILEDVDGELEMEDVAPSSEVEVSSSCHVLGSETVCDARYQQGHQSFTCAPPLPQDLPPSPPPLPSSPPPIARPCPASKSLVPQQQLVGTRCNTDISDFHISTQVSILHA